MPLGDVFEATLGMTIGTEKMVNVFHFIQQESDGPISSNQLLADTLISEMIPSYQACTSEDLAFQTLRVRRIHPTVGGVSTHTVGLPGLIAEPSMPPNCAILAAMGGIDGFQRNDRGRFWLPGCPISAANLGRIPTGQRDLVNTFLDTLLTTLSVAPHDIDFRAVLWNKALTIAQNYAAYRVSPRLRTLRSRTTSV